MDTKQFGYFGKVFLIRLICRTKELSLNRTYFFLWPFTFFFPLSFLFLKKEVWEKGMRGSMYLARAIKSISRNLVEENLLRFYMHFNYNTRLLAIAVFGSLGFRNFFWRNSFCLCSVDFTNSRTSDNDR